MNSIDTGCFEIQLQIDQMRENIWKNTLTMIKLDLGSAIQGFIVLAIGLFSTMPFFLPVGIAIILFTIYDICKIFNDFQPHFP